MKRHTLTITVDLPDHISTPAASELLLDAFKEIYTEPCSPSTLRGVFQRGRNFSTLVFRSYLSRTLRTIHINYTKTKLNPSRRTTRKLPGAFS